jgi:hypothetical protein
MSDYERMLFKVANTRIGLSPALQDVVQRVKKAGLHKVAEQFYGQEVTLPYAASKLGSQLVQNHRKFSKVASGIAALKELSAAGDIDLEKAASMFNLRNLKQMVPKAPAAQKAAPIPTELGGRAAQHGNIFAGAAPAQATPPHLARKGLGKTTLRGDLPAVKPLEDYHRGLPTG